MAQATDGTTTNFTGVDSSTGFKVNGTTVIDENGNVDAPITSTDLTLSGSMEVGTTSELTGLVTMTAGIDAKVILAGTETIAAGGTTTAADLTKTVHDVDSDAGGDIVTLADGVAGQIMIFVMKTATGTLTLTPATFLGGTSVTFDAAGDTVMLVFQTTLGWSVIGGNSYTVI